MNHIKTVIAADFRRLLELGFHAEIVKSKRPFAVGDLYHHQEVTNLTAAGNFTGSEFTAKIETVQSGKHLNKNCYQLVWRIIDMSGVIYAAVANNPAIPVIATGVEALNAQAHGYKNDLSELGAGEGGTVVTMALGDEKPDADGDILAPGAVTNIAEVTGPNEQGAGSSTSSTQPANVTASTPASSKGGPKKGAGKAKPAETTPAANTGAAVVTEPIADNDSETTDVNDLF